ncbi:MAG: glycosyltransferase family 2 protein [Clostridium sp.]|nr:glycosyltransferase family 2 protein [Clostridium sp.]
MITVLTASFNGGKYIRQQLDSILVQSRVKIGILVSDDCSSDGSYELLEEYQKEHKGQVLALRRSYGSGGAAAHFLKLLKLVADHRPGREGELEKDLWEYGELKEEERSFLKELAGAEYFMLSDQDDVWLPYKGERLLKKMRAAEQGNHGPVLIHSDLRVVDENLQVIAPSFFTYQKISPERNRLSQLLVQNNVTGGAVMINRRMLPFLERMPDTCLMHDSWLSLIAAAFGTTDYVREPLYCYRQHSGNTLGAEKGDNLESVEARIMDGSAARENYRKMFAQAECFLKLYGDNLGEGHRQTLEKFIEIPGRCRLEKMYLMVRYGFTKNSFLRTLGQMLFISV